MPGAEHEQVVAAARHRQAVGLQRQHGTPGAFVVNIWTPGNQPMQTLERPRGAAARRTRSS